MSLPTWSGARAVAGEAKHCAIALRRPRTGVEMLILLGLGYVRPLALSPMCWTVTMAAPRSSVSSSTCTEIILSG